jgi:hypothetical protein
MTLAALFINRLEPRSSCSRVESFGDLLGDYERALAALCKHRSFEVALGCEKILELDASR